MSLPRLTRSRLAALAALSVMVLLVAGCGAFGPPAAVTTEGRDIEWLYYFVLAVALIIWALVTGLILFAIVRYRRKPTDTELPPQIHGNNVLEIVWTVIPTIVVAILFVFSLNTLNTVDATAPTDVRIPRSPLGSSGRSSTCRPTAEGPVRAAGPGDVDPGRQDGPPQSPLEGRHPRLLRPAVPVQARRHPRS